MQKQPLPPMTLKRLNEIEEHCDNCCSDDPPWHEIVEVFDALRDLLKEKKRENKNKNKRG